MRTLNYKTEYQKLLSPEIVSYLAQIHEMKGQQNLFVEAQKDALAELLEIAKIQSTEASNRIEGIITTDDRLKKIVMNKTTPKGRSEREIAGYRDVLNTVHENYDYIPVRPGMILQLHRDLYKFSNSAIGGSFKNSDKIIAEELPDGTKRVRFQPVPAWEKTEAMDTLCDALQEASTDPELDSLLLMPMFIRDFLCIHPFNDGNGRMSRLLTLLLLYRSGYFVGKYISIERLIADSKETYYEVLQESSTGWHEGKNDYLPFVRYMLGVVIAAYREFASRVDILITRGLSKPDRVREIIRSTTGKITKTQIMRQCPDISQKTVERSLAEMLKNGEIIKIGGGRYTSYTWNWEKE
ncbi:MAG: Fic family protein [Clostridia bacterium]|nr:Fic family protein [Clostridia bacterium]